METNIIKQACAELGITQKELAERLGVAEGTVRKWASTGETPVWLETTIPLLLKNHQLEKKINEIEQAKAILKKVFLE